MYWKNFLFSLTTVHLKKITRAHSTIARRHYWTCSYRANKVKKYWGKMQNIAMNRQFFSAIIEIVRELVFSNMHNKFGQDTWKTFYVIAPTRSNYWRKMRKIAIKSAILIFFQPLLNLSENCLFVTCITNLKRIHGHFFKLSRPQGQIIDVKCEKSQ